MTARAKPDGHLTEYQRDIITKWIKEAKCLRMERETSIRSTLSMIVFDAEDEVRNMYDQHWQKVGV